MDSISQKIQNAFTCEELINVNTEYNLSEQQNVLLYDRLCWVTAGNPETQFGVQTDMEEGEETNTLANATKPSSSRITGMINEGASTSGLSRAQLEGVMNRATTRKRTLDDDGETEEQYSKGVPSAGDNANQNAHTYCMSHSETPHEENKILSPESEREPILSKSDQKKKEKESRKRIRKSQLELPRVPQKQRKQKLAPHMTGSARTEGYYILTKKETMKFMQNSKQMVTKQLSVDAKDDSATNARLQEGIGEDIPPICRWPKSREPRTEFTSTNNNVTEQATDFSYLKLSGSYGCFKKHEKGKCITCDVLTETRSFESNYSRKTYKIEQSLTCDSKGVVYLINCLNCGEQYVGKTRLQLSRRHGQHRHEMKHGTSPLGRHFHKSDCEAFELIAIDQYRGECDKTLRDLESYWIKILQTRERGINIQK